MGDLSIKELSDADWLGYKTIRLKSLQESPDSFASTYDRESSFDKEHWQSRLRISPSIHDAIALAAISDQEYIGLLSCVIHNADEPSADLYQMWVAPDWRGRGVATALFDRIKVWATGKGVKSIQLSVTTTNGEAISLYQSIGFRSQGDTEPLREGSNLRSQSMIMVLSEGNELL